MKISERRCQLDLSLGECARRAGLRPIELSDIERGRRRPSDSETEKIASAIGWSVGEVAESLPSDEEIEEESARMAGLLAALAACRTDAKAKGLGKGNGGAGEIECPVCKGALRYSVAAYNDHLWGACSTPDCVRWMQ